MTELINMGGFFAGIGSMFICMVLAILILKVGMKYDKWLGTSFQLSMKYFAFEEEMLDRLATKKGINLQKKIIENDVFRRKDFKKELEEQVFKQAFEEITKKRSE